MPWVVLACAGAVLLLSLGIRQSFGLFLWPICADRGWGREVVSFALALQNLMWGFAQPFAGALADRFGAGKVLVAGGIAYAAGLVTMALAQSPLDFGLGTGALIGLGQSAAGFGVVLGVVARSVPESRRGRALGIVGAAGSFGQFAMLPGAQLLIGALGWAGTLLAFAVLALAIAPLGLAMAGAARRSRPDAPDAGSGSLREALARAAAHPGFWMLSASVFVCGFQTAFIMNHLPAYLIDRGLTAQDGMTALTLIGAFNIFGSYAAGWLGDIFSKRHVLAAIYALRAAGIAAFVLLPVSPWTLWLFAALMGAAWLGTIPLSNAIVAQVFGLRHLATLFSAVFLAHQIGGFLGVWAAGAAFDATGSYAAVWWSAALLGVLAALVCLPIDERALERPAMRQAA
jgi:MFS family permease